MKVAQPIEWTSNGVVMLDQRRLPAQVIHHTYTDYRDVAAAIKNMVIRGAPAIGGMSALIPIKNDPAANEAAIEKVRQDKLREVRQGHDGTWVAHPALVPVAREVFDAHMPGPNQIERRRDDVRWYRALATKELGKPSANAARVAIHRALVRLAKEMAGGHRHS